MKKTSNISWLQEKHNFSYSFALQLLKKHRIAGHLLDPEQAIIRAKALQEEERKRLDEEHDAREARAKALAEQEEKEKLELATRDAEWKKILDRDGEEALLIHVEHQWLEDNHSGGGFNAVCEAIYNAERLIADFKERHNL